MKRSAESEEKRQAHQAAVARLRRAWHAEGYDSLRHLRTIASGSGDLCALYGLMAFCPPPPRTDLADALAWLDLDELSGRLRACRLGGRPAPERP